MEIEELRTQKKLYETLWLKELAKRRAEKKKHHHYKQKCNGLMRDNEKLYTAYRKKHLRPHGHLSEIVPLPDHRAVPQPRPQTIPHVSPTKMTVEAINYNDLQNMEQRPVFDHWMYNDH
jgi:hypothetical protein